MPAVDVTVYLGYLQRRLHAAGGTVEQRKLDSWAEAPRGPAVVNCRGLGARSLVPDAGLRPIRGQHVVVSNPGLTEFFSKDTGTRPFTAFS